ncbi:MAG: hypothetical protein M0Q90_01990 [Bacteroidales bacterium]|nr:hypothetical protein [Bacteroidales bacterium]
MKWLFKVLQKKLQSRYPHVCKERPKFAVFEAKNTDLCSKGQYVLQQTTRYFPLNLLFSIFVCCLAVASPAQESQSVADDFQIIYGYVYDVSGNKLEGVNIYQINGKDTLAVSVTDRDGFYYLSLNNEIEILKFDRIGFNPYYVDISMEATTEDNQIDIVLIKKTYSLPEVTVSDEATVMAYENKDTWVYDYILHTNGIMLLIEHFSKKTLLKINYNQDTILKSEVPNKFNNLLHDALGNHYLSKNDSMHQIVTAQNTLQLMYGIKRRDYFTKIWPIVYKNDNIVILKKYANYNNEIIYTKFDRKKKQYSVFKRITNVDQLKNALDFISTNMMTASANEFSLADSAEVAAFRQSFKNTAYFRHFLAKPVYSPLFGLKENIVLFDLENDSVCTYDYLGKLINKKYINFDHTKQFKRIYQDTKTDKFYAAFEKSGKTSLAKIDVENGILLNSFTLEGFDFPEDISIFNNEVYFLYRDRFSSIQPKKYLYKTQLN